MNAQEAVAQPEKIEKASMSLLFVGDCMFGRLVNDLLEDAPPEYPWGDTLPIFRRADWRVCNLECVLSDRGTPWAPESKPFHFRSASKNIAVLQAAKIDAVSIANNHVLDYGEEALLQMLEILDGAGIVHSGAGKNLAEASRLACATVQGWRLGFAAFTDNEASWEAAASRPGIFYLPVDLTDRRAKNLLGLIGESKKDFDILIVSAHWGPNWGYEPPKEHVAFAHALIDAGADLIFGHSSHVFRGIEFYRGRPILYGTGNFIDDYAVDEIERNDYSFIFLIKPSGAAPWRLWLYPTMIHDFHASRALGEQARPMVDKMTELCTALGTPVRWLPTEQSLEIVGSPSAIPASLAAPR
jgi:poly-gamma-glutamate capsule biosynthesis protein CapA/YwtB (metallophosphatase superfamily)